MVVPLAERCRMSPVRFWLGRFDRFGLLGLLDRDPLGQSWGCCTLDSFEVELIPVGTADATERMSRLSAVLYALTAAAPPNNAPTETDVKREAAAVRKPPLPSVVAAGCDALPQLPWRSEEARWA